MIFITGVVVNTVAFNNFETSNKVQILKKIGNTAQLRTQSSCRKLYRNFLFELDETG